MRGDSIFDHERDRRGEYDGDLAGHKKQNPAAGGLAGFNKDDKKGQSARLTYLANMYFATWALARLAALRCTTPDLIALSIAEA